MRSFVHILAIIFLVGCSTTVKVKDDVVAPIITPEGYITCTHTHDASRNFTYKPPIKKYTQTLFEQEVITYEFILISGEAHFLSGNEEGNYDCNRSD